MIKNAKFLEYCFYMNTNIEGNFRICISVSLKLIPKTNLNTKDNSLVITEAAWKIYLKKSVMEFISSKNESIDMNSFTSAICSNFLRGQLGSLGGCPPQCPLQ